MTESSSSSIMCSEILVGLTTFIVTWFLIKWYRKSRLDLPGPFAWPIIGNGLSMGPNPQEFFKRMARKYGGMFQIKLGNVPVVVLCQRDIIREALVHKKTIFSGRPVFESFKNISYGKGVAFNSPLTMRDQWRKNKSAILKHLHRFTTASNTRSKFAGHLQREIVELIHEINKSSKETKGGIIQDPQSKVTVSVANVICALIFGKRYDYSNKEFQELVSVSRLFGEVVGAGSQLDVMPWLKIIPYFKRMNAKFHYLNNRTNNWARQRMIEHQEKYEDGVIRDIVDSMWEAMKDNEMILPLTIDIFGATYDTMSAAVQWILLYLAKYPKYQKKIRQEIAGFTEDDQLPDSALRDLPIMESFIHELFRHSSFLGSTIPHMTLEDTELFGHRIPKHTVIFINQNIMNNDPDVWENPDEFNPGRFLDKNGQILPDRLERYMVFSEGARKCPGKQLATFWARLFVSTFVHLCEIEDDPNNPSTLEHCGNLTTRPSNLRIRLKILKPYLIEHIRSDQEMVLCNGSSRDSAAAKNRDVTSNGVHDLNTHVSTSDEDTSHGTPDSDSASESSRKSSFALRKDDAANNNNNNVKFAYGDAGHTFDKNRKELSGKTTGKTQPSRKIVEILDSNEMRTTAASRLHVAGSCAIANTV